MKKCTKLRTWAITAGLCVSCLGGCQLSPTPQGNNSPFRPQTAEASTQTLPPSQMADVQVGLGRSLEKRGQITQAMAAYQEALKLDPNRCDADLRMAMLLDQQGKFAASEQYYKKALALRPGNPDIYCNMGYSLYLQRRLPEAEMNFRQAIALDASHSRAHNNLGLVLAQVGRQEDAMSEFRKGGCGVADAHANLAFALMLQKSLPEAQSHYQQALAMDPSLATAQKGLQKLDSILSRPDSGVQPASFATRQAPSTSVPVVPASVFRQASSSMPVPQ